MRRWNTMKVMVIVVAFVLFSFQAWATPIQLASVPFSDLGNAGDGTVQTWLIAMITAYNTTHDPDLPTDSVGAHPDIKVIQGGFPPPGYPSFGEDTLSIALPGNLNDYLVLHWGGPGGGTFQAFDLTTTPEVSDIFTAPGRNGLSFYSFYGEGESAPIPEPATMLLLGSGLIGLVGYAKKKFFKK
ncbi:MAG: hypothetical protein A2156_12750 [Deltaproteobacteria bacterium RBG_16_48_10]|nr:MAG: hypothetical protein A2156_12750 [Deltaproteobacteria bacterium RBG_16_48_10]